MASSSLSPPAYICHASLIDAIPQPKWSQLPLMQPDQITDRINEDGVYGFTGTSTELPDKGSPGSPQYELGQFVRDRWPEDKWETAWVRRSSRLGFVVPCRGGSDLT